MKLFIVFVLLSLSMAGLAPLVTAIGYSDQIVIGSNIYNVVLASNIYTVTANSVNIYTNSNPRTAIQKALDLASKSGGIVNLETLTYIVDGRINIGRNTHLKGAGIYKSIIKLKDYTPKFSLAGIIRSSKNIHDFIISQLTDD